jgi:hypothetical protein
VVSLIDISNGLGGLENKALVKLKPNLKRAINEKTKRKKLIAGIILSIFLFFIVI